MRRPAGAGAPARHLAAVAAAARHQVAAAARHQEAAATHQEAAATHPGAAATALQRRPEQRHPRVAAARRAVAAARRGQRLFRCRRQLEVHVLGELPLVSTSATNPDAAALAGRDRRPVGQGRGGVATVPSDVECARLGAVLEASRLESALDIAGIEPVAIDRTTGRGVGYEGHQARAVRAGGRISTGDIGRTGQLLDKRK